MKSGKYERIIAPKNYPGKKYKGRYCYEHHWMWWKHTGELIVRYKEHIHHINGDGRDNRFENLKKVTFSEHRLAHSLGRTYVKLTCTTCGVGFYREKRNVAPVMNKGQKDFYCNRTCMAKHFGRGRAKSDLTPEEA